MSIMPPDGTPLDMRDLLIRLDQRVADGFDNMNKGFAEQKRETDALKVRVTDIERDLGDRPMLKAQHFNLVTRVDDLEDAHAEVSGAIKATRLWGAVIVGVIAVLGYLGLTVELRSAQPVATSKTVQTVTVPTG
ncbi:MAG: hypothetical protein E7773_10265 [Sphingomonas sp.]|uniref:hypothetical protein n=1 Tax=Sphingomonas sp. TaxID=28214 RepID=UPI00122BD01C|nr:hypothetical protein [Sphingomonas sp.]THD35722.1 MAG: hypothetical protein E7773_10265 [Sphingomonas sp.]